MTNTVLEVMNYIDPALVEEVELDGKKRRMSASLRVGLIAACMCLALLGSSIAAALLNGVFMGKTVHNEELKTAGIVTITEERMDGVELHLEGMDLIPQAQISEDFREKMRVHLALCDELDQTLSFECENWSTAAEWTGLPLGENEVLQTLEPNGCSISTGGISDDYRTISVWTNYKFEEKNAMVSVDAIFNIENTECIELDHYYYMWMEGSLIEQESWVLQDGSSAVIEVICDDSVSFLPPRYYYMGHVIQNGGLYNVCVDWPVCEEEGRALLEQILNSFA